MLAFFQNTVANLVIGNRKVSYYLDDDHLGKAGAELVVPGLMEHFKQSGAGTGTAN